MTPPASRRAALNFIFITVLLDMMALGIIVPHESLLQVTEVLQ